MNELHVIVSSTVLFPPGCKLFEGPDYFYVILHYICSVYNSEWYVVLYIQSWFNYWLHNVYQNLLFFSLSIMSNSLATPWTIAHQIPLSGISQARILEWVAISFSKASSWPRDRTCISCIVGGFLITEPPTLLYPIAKMYFSLFKIWRLYKGESNKIPILWEKKIDK